MNWKMSQIIKMDWKWFKKLNITDAQEVSRIHVERALSYSGDLSIVLTWNFNNTKEVEEENYSLRHLQYCKKKR
jgi:hypothetical protein